MAYGRRIWNVCYGDKWGGFARVVAAEDNVKCLIGLEIWSEEREIRGERGSCRFENLEES